MKNKWISLGLLLTISLPALADKVKWTCDDLDRVMCPKPIDKTDFCEATDGIDTFNVKAERDDKEKPKENGCVVSVRVVAEVCGSEFNPAPFEIKCTDIEEKPGAETPATPGNVVPPPPTHGHGSHGNGNGHGGGGHHGGGNGHGHGGRHGGGHPHGGGGGGGDDSTED